TEVHVITFEKRRPMRCKHPINATTNRPAGCGVGGLATILKTTNGDPYVCTCMSPGRAALKVEQHVGHHGVSDAGRQGVEPLVIEVSDGRETSECSAWECPAFTVACVIKQFAEADHKSTAELIIAANLTATGKARTISGD